MDQQNERTQPKKRTVKRRVRYDRIFIALAVVVLILILFFSCTCSCIKCVCGSSDKAETSDTEKTTENDEKESSASGTTAPLSAQQDSVSLTVSFDDVKKGPLVIVNTNSQYAFPAGDASLVSVEENRNSSYSADNAEIMLDQTAVSHLNEFISEFSTLYGKTDVKIEGGYRSKEEQDSKYANGSSIFAGGYSDYHTGRSFDICITPEDGMQSYYVASGDYAWINDNAYKYGFIVRYPEGKMDATGVNPRAYTFHYAGVPHSYYMQQNNLCLEEYAAELKNYPASSPLTVDTGDAVWTVFYAEVPVGGNAVINIPGCQEYTLSGDNIGGLIVAYH
ncbi:MAG: D-alanyl-D-alanine carboxypeptidase family protein [Ruminococcus sp.]